MGEYDEAGFTTSKKDQTVCQKKTVPRDVMIRQREERRRGNENEPGYIIFWAKFFSSCFPQEKEREREKKR